MDKPGRLRIRGLDEQTGVQRVIADHLSGKRKIRPLVEYQADPIGFLVDVLQFPRETLVWSENPGYATHTWDGTPDPLVRACDVLAGKVAGKKHAAIEAATGTQKTYTAAGLVLWFLGSFEDALVVTTSPKEKQLKEGLWKEIASLLPAFKKRFPRAQGIELKIRMRPSIEDPVTGTTERQEKWSAVGWVSGVDAGAESAVKSQGFHAEHMLVVVEEFPGMDPAIVTALKNTLTAPHNILLGLGNPDNQLDPLHQFSELPTVEAIRISAFDHPNVVTGNDSLVPGATSRGFIEERRSDYGEDGPLYLSRARGLSPKEAHNSLFRADDLAEANRKWEAIMGRTWKGEPRPVDQELRQKFMRGGRRALGADPANTPNGDRFALAEWCGALAMSIEKIACSDAYAFGKEIAERAREKGILAEHIGVDNVGVGSGTVNYLRHNFPHGKRVVALQGGADDALESVAKADELTQDARGSYRLDANRFLNLRAQVYWNLAQKMRRGTVAVPAIPELVKELLAIRYETEGGVVRLEPKKDIAKRLGRSPDFSDALVYGDHVRPPLPMEQEQTEAQAAEDARDRSPSVDWKHGKIWRETDEEELDRIFVTDSRVEWRRAGRQRARW